MTFFDVCSECIKNKDLLEQFNRLTGHKLGVPYIPIINIPIIAAIDRVCDYDPNTTEALPDFINFVYECIWLPLVHTEVKNA